MFWFVVLFVVALVVVFLAYTLRQATGDDRDGGSLDEFVGADDSSDTEGSHKPPVLSKYEKIYTEEGKQVLILFGTEYGFSEELAKKLFDELEQKYPTSEGEAPLQPRLLDMRHHSLLRFEEEQVVLIICSTTGDGVPPTEARPFFELLETTEVELKNVSFSVLALGDTNYPHYCRAGQQMETLFERSGAKKIADRVDVDQEDWNAINKWMSAVVTAVGQQDIESRMDYLVERGSNKSEKHNRNRPYWSIMDVKREITNRASSVDDAGSSDGRKATGSINDEDKEVIHCEFDLGDSELEYEAGDALGIYPINNPPEVEALMRVLGFSAAAGDSKFFVELSNNFKEVHAFEEKREKGEDGAGCFEIPLETALSRCYDLKTVRPELLTRILDKQDLFPLQEEKRAHLTALLKDGVSPKENVALQEYLYGREVADVLEDVGCPDILPSQDSSDNKDEGANLLGDVVREVLRNMKALQPRYYSISSSPVVDSKRASVTAAVVRYQTLNKKRTGVTTTYLADRVQVNESCPVFISRNPDFRLPTDGSRPVIMIGPGTGIAPFRAFVQERVFKEATGLNLLYFGCRYKDQDFLYQAEFEELAAQGKLRLRTAFSREKNEKVYVQHRIAEDAVTLWELLENDAHVYVCGDAKRMAGDVHATLLQVIREQGNKSEEEAKAYMDKLEKDHRYQKDVWV